MAYPVKKQKQQSQPYAGNPKKVLDDLTPGDWEIQIGRGEWQGLRQRKGKKAKEESLVSTKQQALEPPTMSEPAIEFQEHRRKCGN